MLTLFQALPDGTQLAAAPMEGYKIVPMQWKGVIKEGEAPVSLNGTIEVRHVRALELFATILTLSVSRLLLRSRSLTRSSSWRKKKRTTLSPHPDLKHATQ